MDTPDQPIPEDDEPDTSSADGELVPDDAEPDAESQELQRVRAASLPAAVDPAKLPANTLAAAAPPKAARGLAFGSIAIGGLCGGLIGYAFTDLQCTDGCATWAGISAVVGAVLGAVGVAIVAVLVLRAMDEWETVKDQQPRDHPSRKQSQ